MVHCHKKILIAQATALVDTDCAGVCGGDAVVDECGVCDGSGIADGACDCDGTLPQENFDCAGNCLVDTDCAGVCGGDAVVDECGVCDGSGIADGACDCDGTLPQENFDCAGNCLVDTDCAGVCGGDAVVDECGVCDGSGIADGACDCDGTLPQENFDCAGNCLVDTDCAGVCGGDAVVDECGVCDGSGIADGACDCDGTLPNTCWDGSSSCELCPDTPTNYPDWDLNFDGVLDNFNDYENNGSITSKVYDTDGNNISSMGDMVAAFVGSEQRGIGVATSVPVFLGGGYAFLMMVYSNETSGETLSFKYYSSSTDEVLDLTETKEFITNMVEGDVGNPFVLTLSAGTVELVFDFSPGWNWFSVNSIQDNMSINNAFSTLTAQAHDLLKVKLRHLLIMEANMDFILILHIDVDNMYMLRLGSGASMVYEGTPVDPGSNSISINSGWNWIGYYPQVSLDLSTAIVSSPFHHKTLLKAKLRHLLIMEVNMDFILILICSQDLDTC